jgi:hypothetical protein
LLDIHRRRNQDNLNLDDSRSTEHTTNRRERNVRGILSAAEAMYNECAVDADALGFMAKMLVQTTLPHRAQPGKQHTGTDDDVTLSITNLGVPGYRSQRSVVETAPGIIVLVVDDPVLPFCLVGICAKFACEGASA